MAAWHRVGFDEKQLGISGEVGEWEQKHFGSWSFTTFSTTCQILVFSQTSPLRPFVRQGRRV